MKTLRIVYGGLAALLAVTALQSLAQDPVTNGGFETVRRDGSAPGWEILGRGSIVTDDAFAGRRALRLVRSADDRGESGLNRLWKPNSGERGGMLAQTAGAIRFRYKALSQARPGSLTVQIIPMNAKPLEFGGHRVRWDVPAHHVGDGEWHLGEFAYDFSDQAEVRWVHVSARLLGPGELWLDAIEWVPEIDAVPYFASLSFEETRGREGSRGKLSATLKNLGSKPLAPSTAALSLPDGLTSPDRTVVTSQLPPGESTKLTWVVEGERSVAPYTLEVALNTTGKPLRGQLTLDRDIALSHLRVPGVLVQPGEPVVIDLVAENTGHVLVDSLSCTMEGPAGIAIEALPLESVLRPGLEAPVTRWRVTLPEPASIIRLRAGIEGMPLTLHTEVVCAAPGPPPSSPERASYAVQVGSWWLVGSPVSRLALFPVGDAGSRGAFLQVRRGATWVTVGTIPRLGLIRTPEGESALAFSAVERADGPSLVLFGSTTIAGHPWRGRCRLATAADASSVDCTVTVVNDGEAADLLAFEGPMLYAGRGLPEREDAVLPGLEWLVRGERSSNALDIKPDHPDRMRHVPHPRKVTIPAAGMRFGDIGVGLFWPAPPQQASRDVAGSASLVFASPDRFGGHASHLIGLMLPGVDKALPENARTADPALRVESGQALTLEGTLCAESGVTDALGCVDRWIERYGVPSPLPFPNGDPVSEIAFSLQAYRKDKALWNPEWEKWYSDIIVGFRPTTGPAWELLVGAELLGSGRRAAWARDLATDVLGISEEQIPRQFDARAGLEQVGTLIERAHRLIITQGDDGNWGFGGEKADPDWPEDGVNYGKLGPEGARAVGLSASNAKTVLDAALLSGDDDLAAAGVKALAAMRSFDVPRAAQVWEVPAHTPDILASARAADAFLSGYRLTGDQAYLDDAVFWARTGIPFVYMWHDSDLPEMQGATIPVFGATQYMLSWFAVAVQWNGLAYSDVLYDLAEIDDSHPWKAIADNILRSAMQQQTREGERLAQWPDAVNFIPGRPGLHGQTPPCFRPTTIIDQTLRGMGIHRHPQHVPLRRDGDQAVIRTCARIEEADWEGETARITAAFTAPQFGTVAVFHVGRPKQVVYDGTVVRENAALSGALPEWHWDETRCVLQVHLPEPGQHSILIRGLRPARGTWSSAPARMLQFDFREGLQGWHSANDLTDLQIDGEALVATTTGADPYLVRGRLQVEGRGGDHLEIEMALSDGADAPGTAVYWGHAEEPGFSASRSASAACPADGRFHVVRVPVGDHAEWASRVITDLRIDPLSGSVGTTVRIRSVRLVRKP